MPKKSALTLLAALLLIALAHQPAFAIQCDDGYQIVQGQPIATPYCEDEYLAQVARDNGMSVSGRAIRQNPLLKDEVCLVVGSDPRVSQICIGHSNRGRGPGAHAVPDRSYSRISCLAPIGERGT